MKIKIPILFFLIILLLTTSFKLFFSKLDFENAVIRKPKVNQDYFSYLDLKSQRWINDQDPQNYFTRIFFEGGDSISRGADFITYEEERVLKFWVNSPNVKYKNKSRVQLDVNFANKNGKGTSHIKQSFKILFPKSLEKLQNYTSSLTWFTFLEVWNGHPSEKYPFRITLGLFKEKKSTKIFFKIIAEEYDVNENKFIEYWSEVYENEQVVFGEWYSLKFEFISKKDKDGSVRLIDISKNKETVFFNIKNYTYNKNNPEVSSVKMYNPLKLYTSAEITKYVTESNSTLYLLFKDLEIKF